MRTVLAPLTLEGLGTPGVESLASYFIRLATAHQVTPAQLAKVICNETHYLVVDGAPALKHGELCPSMLCSYSAQTRVLVHRLQKLTGAQHLACGTLLPLARALCQNQTGALAHLRRWCPQCYAEAPENFAEPLAWSLPLVARCLVHDMPLEDRCPHCGRHQRNWCVGERRRLCGKCGRSLCRGAMTNVVWAPWDAWCQAEMVKILAHTATPDAPDVHDHAFEIFLGTLPASSFTDRNGLGHCLSRLRLDRAKRPMARARMSTIFRVAAQWGTTPLDIFLRPVEAASPLLFEAAAKVPRPPARPRYSLGKLESCRQTFIALLALPSSAVLLSTESVCDNCGVNCETFHRHYGDLWSAYIAERRSRQTRRVDRQVASADKYMRALLIRLARKGTRLHRKNTVAAMMADVRVSKAIARSALRAAVARLRVERDRPNTTCGKA